MSRAGEVQRSSGMPEQHPPRRPLSKSDTVKTTQVSRKEFHANAGNYQAIGEAKTMGIKPTKSHKYTTHRGHYTPAEAAAKRGLHDLQLTLHLPQKRQKH